jgi:hypothetical protein
MADNAAARAAAITKIEKVKYECNYHVSLKGKGKQFKINTMF